MASLEELINKLFVSQETMDQLLVLNQHQHQQQQIFGQAQLQDESPASLTVGARVVPARLFAMPQSQTDKQVMARDGTFQYKPLDASKSDFRALALQGLKEEDHGAIIRCCLTHVDLNKDVHSYIRSVRPFEVSAGEHHCARSSYENLSYTWGKPYKTSRVLLDGHEFPVTENLHEALWYTRKGMSRDPLRPNPVFCFWIDAICINQENTVEKNAQIGIMRRIYRNGANVRVWLRPEEVDSDLAIQVIKRLNRVPQRGPGDAKVEYPGHSAKRKDKALARTNSATEPTLV